MRTENVEKYRKCSVRAVVGNKTINQWRLFNEQEIASGRFRDRAEVLDAGIGLLRQRKAIVDRLANSRHQLDSEQYVELDSAGLRQVFDDLKSRARQLAAGENGD